MTDSKRKQVGEISNTLHAISFLRECPDNQFLVIVPPSFGVGNNIDLRSDKVRDIFPVSSLVFKGDAQRC